MIAVCGISLATVSATPRAATPRSSDPPQTPPVPPASANEVLSVPHFRIEHWGDTRQAALLAVQLEDVLAAHRRFVRELGLPNSRLSDRLHVRYLPTWQAYQQLVQGAQLTKHGGLGHFDPSDGHIVLYAIATHPELVELRRALADAERPDEYHALQSRLQAREILLQRSIIRHETAHLLQAELGIFPSFDDMPRWLVEGLATLFETLEFPAHHAPQPINTLRRHELIKLHGDDPDLPARLRRLILEKECWREGSDYALAWAICHHLYADRPRALGRLLQHIAEAGGLPDDEHLRRRLLERLLGPFDDDWAHAVLASVGMATASQPTTHPTTQPPTADG